MLAVPSLAIQLSVLATLEEPRSASEVAEHLELEEIEVEEAVTELEEAGLVEREGFGAKTHLVPTAPELPRSASQARAGMPPDAWQALFAEDRAQLAYVLTQVGRLELAAFVLGDPVETLRREVHDLTAAGVLARSEPFQLDPGVPGLAELLAEIDLLRARRWVGRLETRTEIVWHLGPEILFRAEDPVTDAEVTYGGPSLCQDHGIELETSEHVYCRTHRDLDASDAILQTILTEPDSDEWWEACIRLFADRPTPTFAEKARIYGLQAEADEIREAAGAV